MSSEQISSTSDLRSSAQDYKRDAAQKHKWALGSVVAGGRAAGKPRPHRPSETNYNAKRRESKGAVASMVYGNKGTTARKQDMLDGTAVSDGDSAVDTNSDEYDGTPSPPMDSNVMYSFDATKGPSQGSQILNVALAKAVEKYEEKATAKLVKDEYDMIDSAGETVVMTAAGKKRGSNVKAKKAEQPVAAVPDADEDYEFI